MRKIILTGRRKIMMDGIRIKRMISIRKRRDGRRLMGRGLIWRLMGRLMRRRWRDWKI